VRAYQFLVGPVHGIAWMHSVDKLNEPAVHRGFGRRSSLLFARPTELRVCCHDAQALAVQTDGLPINSRCEPYEQKLGNPDVHSLDAELKMVRWMETVFPDLYNLGSQGLRRWPSHPITEIPPPAEVSVRFA
jgi:hypothetical protein